MKTDFFEETDEDARAPPSGLESLGVNYRALDDVLRVVRAREPVAEHVVTVSVLEIYNEECRDRWRSAGDPIDVARVRRRTRGPNARETARRRQRPGSTASRLSRATRMTSSRRCARAKRTDPPARRR